MNRFAGNIETPSLQISGYGHVLIDYVVRGAGLEDANGFYIDNGNNEYYGDYTRDGYQYRLVYHRRHERWQIERISDANHLGTAVYMAPSGPTNEIPVNGWSSISTACDPPPTVLPAPPTLSYDADAFLESVTNDGTIGNALTVTYDYPEGDSFSGPNGVFEPTKYTAANVPDGLSVEITKIADTELSVSLTGAVTEHSLANCVANLELAFHDTAFTGGDAAAIYDSTRSDLAASFYSPMEFRVNATTDSDQFGGQVSSLDDGGFCRRVGVHRAGRRLEPHLRPALRCPWESVGARVSDQYHDGRVQF